jgi:hypothetical protein
VPLLVVIILGGPALRPLPVTRTLVVGVKSIFVVRGWTEMSVRLPVTVAACEEKSQHPTTSIQENWR